MKIRIGDKVKIDKEKTRLKSQEHPCCDDVGYLPYWYSNEIYIVKKIEEETITLDRNLSNSEKNVINIHYLKNLKKERKKKLLKLDSV